ncbi:MAG: hypothetical protein H2058_08775 [Muricauda sp.]|nr:O-antigen ligase family protein [Allomuricauda sp.]MBA4745339.1 hypothetical protein [Allomuricauda sp.]
MKIKFGNGFFLASILSYPVLLGAIFFFDLEPFRVTAPYFFIILLFLSIKIVRQRKFMISKQDSSNLLIILLVVLVSAINFTTVRYSIPILFATYSFILFLYLTTVESGFILKNKIVRRYLVIYLLMAVMFLFVSHAYMEVGERYIGFTGSPTTFAGLLAALFILFDTMTDQKRWIRVLTFLFVLFFVGLSKTRLVIIFLIGYPVLRYVINKKALNRGGVFLIFFLILFFVYSLYGIVVENYPELITLRYKDARDASFGLRYRLYQIVEENFFLGNKWEILFGKGNEYSRNLIIEKIGLDIFPHNDFIRLINDWGILGAGIFFVLLYRLALKNITSLLIALLYIVLWYSNMIFNLYLVSILIISSFYHENMGGARIRK